MILRSGLKMQTS